MLLLIDNYDSFTYNLFQYLSELGEEVLVVRNNKITIGDIEKISPQLPSGTETAGQMGILGAVSFGEPIVTSTEFVYFTIPIIFVTALISSFIISAIRTGSRVQGMKYFPFVLLLSYLVYWGVTELLNSFFATFS